jgi:hypothetical protein
MTVNTPKGKTKRARRFRPSPALVISLVALFSTLAGTALALPTGSVFSRHIADQTIRAIDLRDNSVMAPKIAEAAVNSAKVEDESLTAGDLGAASVGSSEVVEGSLDAGDLAANSVASSELGSVVTRVNVVNVASGTQNSVLVSCLPGETMLGGGGGFDGQIVGAVLQRSDRVLTTQSWRVDGQNFSGAARPLYARVICLQ